MTRYTPPQQSKTSQIVDVLVLLIAAVVALYAPLLLGLAGSTKTGEPAADATWESLGQNATMVDRWEKLGFATPADAAVIIAPRFDYSINWLTLIALVVAIIGYYVIMLRFSEQEYREVIAEKFGEEEGR